MESIFRFRYSLDMLPILIVCVRVCREVLRESRRAHLNLIDNSDRCISCYVVFSPVPGTPATAAAMSSQGVDSLEIFLFSQTLGFAASENRYLVFCKARRRG